MNRITLLILSLVSVGLVYVNAQKPAFNKFIDLDSIYNGNQGSFVMYHIKANTFYIYDVETSNIAYPVYSTSKIIWSAIALESGLVKNTDETMIWDSVKYIPTDFWPQSWRGDQTIISALKNSVNWYYFELLLRFEPAVLQEYLIRLGYIHNYKVETNYYPALVSTIKKTSFDQVYFLEKLQNNTLPVSTRTAEILRKGMLLEKTDDYAFYFRTGLGPVNDDVNVGWYIGYIEKGDEIYIFALNVLHENELEAMNLRNRYIRQVLTALRIL